MFIKKYKSLSDFSNFFNKLVNNQDYESALRELFYYSYIVQLNPLKNQKYQSSSFIDGMICKLSSHYRSSNLFKKNNSDQTKNNVHLFDMYIFCSKYQKTGGHSRIIDDLIDKHKNKNILILSTEIYGKSDYIFFHKKYSERKRIKFLSIPGKNFFEKLSFLSCVVDNAKNKKIFLLNSNSDPIHLSSINYKKINNNVHFIHHADYSFSLGATLNLKHYDLNHMQRKLCSKHLFIDHKVLNLFKIQNLQKNYLKNSFNSLDIKFDPEKINFVIVGNYNKFFPDFLLLDLFYFYKAILKDSKHRIYFVGNIPIILKLFLLLMLQINLISPKRSIFLKYSDSLKKTYYEINANIFVPSFPIFGGLSLLEALSFGLPVMIKDNKVKYFSGIPYLKINSFISWNSFEDLKGLIKSLDKKFFVKYSKLSRDCFAYGLYNTDASKHKNHSKNTTINANLKKEQYYYRLNTFQALSLLNKLRFFLYYIRALF
jgi:hypothetical protein